MCVLRALAGGMSHSCFYSRVWVEYKLLLQHAHVLKILADIFGGGNLHLRRADGKVVCVQVTASGAAPREVEHQHGGRQNAHTAANKQRSKQTTHTHTKKRNQQTAKPEKRREDNKEEEDWGIDSLCFESRFQSHLLHV